MTDIRAALGGVREAIAAMDGAQRIEAGASIRYVEAARELLCEKEREAAELAIDFLRTFAAQIERDAGDAERWRYMRNRLCSHDGPNSEMAQAMFDGDPEALEREIDAEAAIDAAAHAGAGRGVG